MAAEGVDDPVNYTEIDLSPAGGLWAGAIYNPTGLHPLNTTLLDCAQFNWFTSIVPEGWQATLRIPFTAIRTGGAAGPGPLPAVWR